MAKTFEQNLKIGKVEGKEIAVFHAEPGHTRFRVIADEVDGKPTAICVYNADQYAAPNTKGGERQDWGAYEPQFIIRLDTFQQALAWADIFAILAKAMEGEEHNADRV